MGPDKHEGRTQVRPIPGSPKYWATISGEILSARSGRVFEIKTFEGSRRGYLKARLGRVRNEWVHRLVCSAWRGEPLHEGAVVRHKDDNPKNNHKDNLLWGTVGENAIDKMAKKTPKPQETEKQPDRTEDQTIRYEVDAVYGF